jgi:hypothetical protein
MDSICTLESHLIGTQVCLLLLLISGMRRFGYLINSWKALLGGSGSIGKHLKLQLCWGYKDLWQIIFPPSTLISTAPNKLTCPFWIWHPAPVISQIKLPTYPSLCGWEVIHTHSLCGWKLIHIHLLSRLWM